MRKRDHFAAAPSFAAHQSNDLCAAARSVASRSILLLSFPDPLSAISAPLLRALCVLCVKFFRARLACRDLLALRRAEQVARDDHALHLAGPFINGYHARVAIHPLDVRLA